MSLKKNVKISIMGVTALTNPSPDSILGLWEITESTDELRLGLNLSMQELSQYEARKTESRKREWLACRHLLREMTGSSAVKIGYDAHSRPFLNDNSGHISISHSGSYACVYLDRSRPVGVDIQKIKPSIAAGAFFFISEQEAEWIDLNDNLMLHMLWSAKEAVFKKVGDHELDFKNIRVSTLPQNQNNVLSVTTFGGGLSSHHRIAHSQIDDYILTWTI